MDWFSSNDVLGLISSFVEHNIEPSSFAQLVESLGLGDVVAEPIERTASSYSTICCETDYNFSSEDYSWLEMVPQICEVPIESGRYVIAVELDQDQENYYLSCAALVKIMNHVRAGDALFIFRLNHGIAFGCNRSFGDSIPSDFCVSQFIPVNAYDLWEENIQEFVSSLGIVKWDEIPQLIIDFSPQEKRKQDSKYDRVRFNPEYILFLKEFSSVYDVDTTRQADEYIRSFEDNSGTIEITYQEAAQLLVRVGAEVGSSYDTLNAADEAELLSRHIPFSEDDEISSALPTAADRIIQQYSEEAFADAELLLKEIMKRNN